MGTERFEIFYKTLNADSESPSKSTFYRNVCRFYPMAYPVVSDKIDDPCIDLQIPTFIYTLIRIGRLPRHYDERLKRTYIELDDLTGICVKYISDRDEKIRESVKNGMLKTINNKLDHIINNQCVEQSERCALECEENTNEISEDDARDITERSEEIDEIQLFVGIIIGYVRLHNRLTPNYSSSEYIGADDIRLYITENKI